MLIPTTSKEMARRGRIGAFRLHALHDSRETTAAARAASSRQLNERLLAEIDPGRKLPAEERERRLQHARKAHFHKLALRAHRRRAQNGGGDD